MPLWLHKGRLDKQDILAARFESKRDASDRSFLGSKRRSKEPLSPSTRETIEVPFLFLRLGRLHFLSLSALGGGAASNPIVAFASL